MTKPMTTAAPSKSADSEFRTRRRPCRCRQALPVPGRSSRPSSSPSPSLPVEILARFVHRTGIVPVSATRRRPCEQPLARSRSAPSSPPRRQPPVPPGLCFPGPGRPRLAGTRERSGMSDDAHRSSSQTSKGTNKQKIDGPCFVILYAGAKCRARTTSSPRSRARPAQAPSPAPPTVTRRG